MSRIGPPDKNDDRGQQSIMQPCISEFFTDVANLYQIQATHLGLQAQASRESNGQSRHAWTRPPHYHIGKDPRFPGSHASPPHLNCSIDLTSAGLSAPSITRMFSPTRGGEMDRPADVKARYSPSAACSSRVTMMIFPVWDEFDLIQISNPAYSPSALPLSLVTETRVTSTPSVRATLYVIGKTNRLWVHYVWIGVGFRALPASTTTVTRCNYWLTFF